MAIPLGCPVPPPPPATAAVNQALPPEALTIEFPVMLEDTPAPPAPALVWPAVAVTDSPTAPAPPPPALAMPSPEDVADPPEKP